MKKQHVYAVTVVERHTCEVLVAAHSHGEARLAALARYNEEYAVLDFACEEAEDPFDWRVRDLGEDLGQ